MTAVEWVYARVYSGGNTSLFGLPKLEIVCGDCGRHSKSRAQQSRDRKIFVWCPHCGIANVAQGLVAE